MSHDICLHCRTCGVETDDIDNFRSHAARFAYKILDDKDAMLGLSLVEKSMSDGQHDPYIQWWQMPQEVARFAQVAKCCVDGHDVVVCYDFGEVIDRDGNEHAECSCPVDSCCVKAFAARRS